jgi:hypothetical protein
VDGKGGEFSLLFDGLADPLFVPKRPVIAVSVGLTIDSNAGHRTEELE